jgi:hypothetical protein
MSFTNLVQGAVFKGKPVVGLQRDIPLSRRVQLAVVAHIRHTHTRYDLLLRETSWEQARRTVESLCLDILVKWRGDEETGRDQLDEVLREIVVIDDSEDEEDVDSESEEEESEDDTEEGEVEENHDEVTTAAAAAPSRDFIPLSEKHVNKVRPNHPNKTQNNNDTVTITSVAPLNQKAGISSRTRSKTKPNRRQKGKRARGGIRRYQAWQDALTRRLERPPALQTPVGQNFGLDLREENSPDMTSNQQPTGESAPNPYNRPPNSEYQAIYVMEDGHLPRRPRSVSFISCVC